MEIKKHEREKRKGSGKKRETSDREREEEEVKNERSSWDRGTVVRQDGRWKGGKVERNTAGAAGAQREGKGRY